MADPLVPRHPQGTSGDLPHETGAGDLFRSLGHLVRMIVMGVLFVLLLYGVYYALEVFTQVGGIVKDPQQIKQPIEKLTEIIQGEQLVVPVEGEKMPLGRVVAVVLLGFGYLLWAWIPLLIISLAGRLLLAIAGYRKEPGPPPPPR
ncbi:MAG: hypothetical protein U0939_23595 [Pirellulales bacterium]